MVWPSWMWYTKYYAVRDSAEVSRLWLREHSQWYSSDILSSVMLKTALRVVCPAARIYNRQWASRTLSTTFSVSSGGPPSPKLYGPGAKPGTVPTDLDQATGLERLQLLGETQGINVFDEEPLDSSRIGTKANPVLVPSYVRAYFHFFGIVCRSDSAIQRT